MTDWKRELLQDKSLFELLRRSFRPSQNIVNHTIAIGWACLCFTALCANAMSSGPFVPYLQLADWTTTIALDGLTYTSQILGFLIAGVALFTSAVQRPLVEQLGNARQPGRDRSYLKAVFAEFMNVFTFHLFCLASCIAARLCLGQGSVVRRFGGEVLGDYASIKLFVVSIFSFVVAQSLVVAVLALKSFIWNLYQVIVFALTAKRQNSDP